MQVTFDLTDAQVVALHDLIIDADMHDGRVAYPVPLPEGMEAVTEVLAAARLQAMDAQRPPRDGTTHDLVFEGIVSPQDATVLWNDWVALVMRETPVAVEVLSR